MPDHLRKTKDGRYWNLAVLLASQLRLTIDHCLEVSFKRMRQGFYPLLGIDVPDAPWVLTDDGLPGRRELDGGECSHQLAVFALMVVQADCLQHCRVLYLIGV